MLRAQYRGLSLMSLAIAALLLAAACAPAVPASPAPKAAAPEKPAAAPEKPAAAPAQPAAAPEKPAAAQKPAAPVRPVVIAIGNEPSSLDAQAVTDRHASGLITDSIMEALLVLDRKLQITPLLAESYQSVNDTTWRFKLRRGVTFHDGEPFNAQVAAYSINRMVDKEFPGRRRSYIDKVVGAKVVDDYTIDVTTGGVLATLPFQMTEVPMVSPNPAADFKEFGRKPIGTGPYKFVSWAAGREIKLAANDKHWSLKPSLPEITIRIVPDQQAQLAGMQAGELDLLMDLIPEQTRLVPKFVSTPSADFSSVMFNTYKKEMSDPRVRVAMNLAIDKETLAKTIYQGQAKPHNSQHLADGMLGFNPNLKPFPYDPTRAKQLLAEAGYPNGFSVTLHTAPRFIKGVEASEYIAAQLDAVGIKTKVQVWEYNAFRDARRIQGDQPGAFDLAYIWNSNDWFDGSRVRGQVTCDRTADSSSKICIPKVDELLDGALATLDQKQREKNYQEMWAILYREPWAIYLLHQNFIWGLSNRLQWEPTPDDRYYFAEMKVQG